VARWHHENVDGSGYPDELRGEAIPLAARIVRIADAFDVITHGRIYQPARGLEWAVGELQRFAGSQFDPELVRVFVDLLDADPAFTAAASRPPRANPGRLMTDARTV
jgi:HD-GYP domain-containing protein (c-di-GMP phosphodiesterase class II)